MTIAACYFSSDGVVFGADSTTTMGVPHPDPGQQTLLPHHFNFAQKIFEIGEGSTIAMTMWGLGTLSTVSYRTLIARFADDMLVNPPANMQTVAERWNTTFWNAYHQDLGVFIQLLHSLLAKPQRTPDEDNQISSIRRSFSGGFCLGGHLRHDRTPQAFEINYGPDLLAPGPITPLKMNFPKFWGVPTITERMINGIDEDLAQAIISSPHWKGSPQDLLTLVQQYKLGQPINLPMREAVDWIHSTIYSTIKALKFSHIMPVCGGPVEIAVITTDRPFRWVRHKKLHAAIQ